MAAPAIGLELTPSPAIPTLIAVTGTFALVAIGYHAGGFRWPGASMRIFGGTAAGVAFSGLVIRAAAVKSGVPNQLLLNPLLRAYGKYSYSLYVYHPFFMGQFGILAMKLSARSGKPEWHLPIAIVCAVASNVVIFAVSHLSYRYLESPILRLKERFR
jgi:peptidoglycan/LPS O-acetylase OafA/YrhL